MDKFLIAPFKDGLQSDLVPWLLADNAFEEMNNAYINGEGQIGKRWGSIYLAQSAASGSSSLAQLQSRLRINIGTTAAGTGNLAVAPVPGSKFKVGQQFSVGTEIFTVPSTGNPATLLSTGSGSGTYDTTTGNLSITGATPSTVCYFYPLEPVMGLKLYENGPVNNLPAYAWDTQFGYKFDGTGWERVGTAVWHGTNNDYFWATNWEGNSEIPHLFVSNFFVTDPNGTGTANDDPIRYTNDGSTWTDIYPRFAPTAAAGTGPYVRSARMIIPFKGRLILLNTIENNWAAGNVGATTVPAAGGTNTQYPQRARFSFLGSPLAVNAWYEVNQSDSTGPNYWGGAGAIDAATKEEIVGAEFIKDRLIVYFDRSTWELAYTGINAEPFKWQKLNTIFGSVGTFTRIPFDQFIYNIANNGITACNGSNVQRMDDKIHDEVFYWKVKNNAFRRVHGIRDYKNKCVYWNYIPDDQPDRAVYPTKILVYNYEFGAWAKFDDTITVWGYFEQQQDLTWQNAQMQWQEADFTWQSNVVPAQSRRVIAGNQQGFTFLVEANYPLNAQVLTVAQATDLGGGVTELTITDHNLLNDEFVEISNATGALGINGIFQVTITDANKIKIPLGLGGDVYTGGAVVRKLSQFNIVSKAWNPYKDKATSLRIHKVDFIVSRERDGAQMRVDYSTSGTTLSMIEEGEGSGSLVGTSNLDLGPYALVPLESVQRWLVHPIYLDADGEFVQIKIYFTDDQMLQTDPNRFLPLFQGMVLHTAPTSTNFK